MNWEDLVQETCGLYEAQPGKAELYQMAIRHAQDRRTSYRLAQAQLVVQVVREGLCAQHHKKYATLRQYLGGTGLGKSSVSDLVFIGDLTAFCDRHKLHIEAFLDEQRWPKLREAIPALRRAVAAADVARVQWILRDVVTYSSRDDVRKKYRRRRGSQGHGVAVQTGDDTLVIAARCANPDELAARIGKWIELNEQERDRFIPALASAIQELAA